MNAWGLPVSLTHKLAQCGAMAWGAPASGPLTGSSALTIAAGSAMDAGGWRLSGSSELLWLPCNSEGCTSACLLDGCPGSSFPVHCVATTLPTKLQLIYHYHIPCTPTCGRRPRVNVKVQATVRHVPCREVHNLRGFLQSNIHTTPAIHACWLPACHTIADWIRLGFSATACRHGLLRECITVALRYSRSEMHCDCAELSLNP